MALTVAQLLEPVTKDEALQLLIDILASLDFNVTAWQSGSEQRTFLEMFAETYSTLTETTVTVTEAGFNDLATGDWLTLLSRSHYQNDRLDGEKTEGTVTLAAETGVGPYTIDTGANQIVVADSVEGFTYRNITGGTLSPGSTLDVTIQAETVGADRDVPPNTITVMKAPLAGVTVNNPIPAGEDTWITKNGAFAEQDIPLRTRNSNKWATLSPAVPTNAYAEAATKATAAVTRALVNDRNPRGPGTIDVYIACTNGALVAAVVTEVDDFIRGVTDGISRRAVGDNLLVATAVNKFVPLTGTVFIEASLNTPETQQAIDDAILAYFQVLEIGGTKPDATSAGVVVFGRIFEAAMKIKGVQNVAFTSPTADVTLAINEVAVPDFTTPFTYQSV